MSASLTSITSHCGATLCLLFTATAGAGIFPPAAGQPGSQAVDRNDPAIAGWATGYQSYNPGTEVSAAFQTPAKALGEAGNSDGSNAGVVYDIVSLGRGGDITLSFSPPITDGPGFDFAVFENGFSDTFLELAKVEVSSDGLTFVAFPAMSTVPAPVSGFGTIDPTEIEQVAGKYRGGFGTPFDLARLAGSPGLDISRVRYVRLRDVVGDGSATNGLTTASLADWLGVPETQLPQALIDVVNSAPAAIYDPYPTFDSAGFDLDAVAVLQQGPVPATIEVDPWNTGPIDPASTQLLPVIVYSSALANGDLDEFDATDIQPTTVAFGYSGAQPASAPTNFDWNSDGLDDAGFLFQIQETGIACEDTTVNMSGATNNGVNFEAVGAISTVTCPTNTCHP